MRESPAVTRVLDDGPEELVGHTGYEYAPPDGRESNANAVEAVLEPPDEPHTVEARFTTPTVRGAGSSAQRVRLEDDVIDGRLREFFQREFTAVQAVLT